MHESHEQVWSKISNLVIYTIKSFGSWNLESSNTNMMHTLHMHSSLTNALIHQKPATSINESINSIPLPSTMFLVFFHICGLHLTNLAK